MPDATSLDGNDRRHSGIPVGSNVNVASAEQEFAELSRQLSRRSVVRDTNSASTINGSQNDSKDVEKGEVHDADDNFDLREYLVSSNDANQQAGIKHKVRLDRYGCPVPMLKAHMNVRMLV